MINTGLNALLFNACWLLVVLVHSDGWAITITALYLVVHFIVMGKGLVEAGLVLAVFLAGFALDQLLFLLGLFTFDGDQGIAPLWLSCLWAAFATTLMHAMQPLQSRLLLASLLGALGGGLSYSAGVRLTDIAFGSETWGPVTIALLWGFLLPLLLVVTRKLPSREGVTHA